MKPALALAAALLVITALAACGGDDKATGTPTSSGANGAARTVTATPQGQKTGTPNQRTPSVAATPPGDTPTAPPVAAVGTPAVAPPDQAAFSTSFTGQQVDLKECRYNPTIALVKCDAVIYAIDPPIVGQDITCTLWLVAGNPRALACAAQEPPGTKYYAIQQ